jgi:hypothetical protein
MQTCPRCQRVNPDEAAYCYFDGLDLRDGGADGSSVPLAIPIDAGPARLPHEFVFPTGRHCLTYDELVQGCLEDWASARDLLRQGAFGHFLTGAGRLDLARAAAECVRQHADADLSLDAFLARLPATQVPKAELELQPRKLLLGTLATGESRQVKLVVLNIGSGILHGNISILEGGHWLRFAGNGTGPLPLKLLHSQDVFLEVNARGLPAPHKFAAHLNVITNGGIVEVPVRLDVTALPFTQAPYQSAGTPRELAVLMRANPKPAIPLLENGDVARWFEANGWAYPVNGPTAPRMAAVQQFFESLALAKSPRVQLEEPEALFSCLRGEVVHGQAALSTTDRKWVYGHSSSDVSWIRITTPAVSGPQRALIDFEVESASLAANRMHEGTIQVLSNSGQKLALRVKVDVCRPARPASRGLLRPILVGALAGLLVRLLLAGPADIYARMLAAAPDAALTPGSWASWGEAPLSPQFIRHFVLATWWLGAVVGVVLVVRRSRLLDLPWGLIAGAAAGVAASATLACLWPWLDGPARALWRLLPPTLAPVPSLWAITGAWLAVAALCWMAAGAGLGALVRLLKRPE